MNTEDTYKIIFEFDDEEARDLFLDYMSDGVIEDIIQEAIGSDVDPVFIYKEAYTELGWDGKGDPTVYVYSKEEAIELGLLKAEEANS